MCESDGEGDVKPDMKKATLEILPISQFIHPSRVLTSYLHRVRQRRVLLSTRAASQNTWKRNNSSRNQGGFVKWQKI